MQKPLTIDLVDDAAVALPVASAGANSAMAKTVNGRKIKAVGATVNWMQPSLGWWRFFAHLLVSSYSVLRVSTVTFAYSG